MQNEVTDSLRISFEQRLIAATHVITVHAGVLRVTCCPLRVVGAVSPLRWVCGARLLPALTHFPAVFLRSDRGPSRTSVTSQPTGFSISYCFDWKNVFSTHMQAHASMALPINVHKKRKSQAEKELEQQQKNPVLICRIFL